MMNLKNMLNQTNNKTVLLCVFLTDNHLKNVKTLQSIYKQKQINVFLCLINNGLLDFQCERYIYNLNVDRPQNINQVYLYELEKRKDVVNCVKEMTNKFTTDYLYVLRAGDYLKGDVALKESVDSLSSQEEYRICLLSYEKENRYYTVNTYRSLTERCDELWTKYRDCMFIYDASILDKLIMNSYCDYASFAHSAIPVFLDNGVKVKYEKLVVCEIDADSNEFECK